VRVALYWRATEDLTHDYLLSLQLRDQEGHIWLDQEGRPVDDTYPTTQWMAGEIVKDWHDLQLPPDTSPGTHQLLLKITEQAQLVGQTTLHHLEVAGRPRVFSVPEIQHPMEMTFAETVLFLGYDLAADELRPGQPLQLTLYWQALQEMQTSYTVFTHLLDADEQIRGQMDSVPLSGEAPTTSWITGEVIADPYQITLDPDAPPGDYTIEIGMYDANTGKRLPVYDSEGEAVKEERIALGEVQVVR